MLIVLAFWILSIRNSDMSSFHCVSIGIWQTTR